MLKGKHIVLGITGGIAAYKSAMLARLLVKAGAEVQVIMTPSAREFITPLTLSTLTGKPVITEFFTANTGEWHSHVDLGLWADAMVIAPATACTIGKMAHGIADNMLVTTYLSAKAPVFVAPAMDLDMMAHPSTVANLELLRSYGNHIIEPKSGELASHLVGKGRMEEPERIVEIIDDYFCSQLSLTGAKVMVTAGPTFERIDPVRFIGNFSTGKMGYAIADVLADRGADVTLISGPVGNLKPRNSNVYVIGVESANEMFEASIDQWKCVDCAIMAAAVADYRPREQYDSKIKRETSEIPTIELEKNPDIAAQLGQCKSDGQLLVGFALETDNGEANALDKIRRKNLDAIVLNSLNDDGAGFGFDTNKITIYDAAGNATPYDLKPKDEVAIDIVDYIEKLIIQRKKD